MGIIHTPFSPFVTAQQRFAEFPRQPGAKPQPLRYSG